MIRVSHSRPKFLQINQGVLASFQVLVLISNHPWLACHDAKLVSLGYLNDKP